MGYYEDENPTDGGFGIGGNINLKGILMITRKFRQKCSKIISIIYLYYLRKVKRYDIGKNCNISHRASLDRANPSGIHIGNNTRVMLEALIIAHDYSRGLKGKMWCDTKIGHHCVIGGRSIILPGVELGNHVFVAAGSVVTKSFPSNCMIGGNPAKMIRTGIKISDRTQIEDFGELVKK